MVSAKKASSKSSTLSEKIEQDLTGTYKYVPVKMNTVTINYVTKTAIDKKYHDDLGLITITSSTPVKDLVLHPNNITPPRAGREIADPAGTTDTAYYDPAKLAIASTKDEWWRASKRKHTTYSLSTKFTTLWHTTINNVKIGYIDRRGKAPGAGTIVTDRLTALGFDVTKPDEVGDVVMGASFPACGIATFDDGLRFPYNPKKITSTVITVGSNNVVKLSPAKILIEDLLEMLIRI